MKKLLQISILLVLALALTACGQVSAPSTLAAGELPQAQGAASGLSAGQEGVTVVGTGSASADPEVAYVTLGVELQGEDPSAIVDEAAREIDDVIAAMEGMGIAEEDIETTSYRLWVETVREPETGRPSGEMVYHVSHQIKVTLRDIESAGDLLAAGVEAGANTVSNINFSVEDSDALLEEARQLALADAEVKAQQIADGLDISLGEPIAVMETSGGTPRPVELAAGAREAEIAAPSISPGAFSVSVSVQVVYAIQ